MIPAGTAHSATSPTRAGSPPTARQRLRVIQIASVMPTRYISPYTWTYAGPMWMPLAGGLGICDAMPAG